MMRNVRLELARTPDFPEGSSAHGYEFTAPLHPDGTLDEEAWKAERQACKVRRFWAGDEDEHGRLVHARNKSWAFHYDGTDSDHDEPIFRFDRHRFVEGEYVSITEHDGVQRTFRVIRVR
ncbi:MAG: hypothetical protein ISP41_19865 [Alphaproteobacteria bacterium]|jgi:hypothetical protein|nr:hypothetical protein [Alphaproteobacteria bacterium]